MTLPCLPGVLFLNAARRISLPPIDQRNTAVSRPGSCRSGSVVSPVWTIWSLVSKGLTAGEVSAHLAEVYGASESKDTISAITDRVLEGMAEWQNRPLDPPSRPAIGQGHSRVL